MVCAAFCRHDSRERARVRTLHLRKMLPNFGLQRLWDIERRSRFLPRTSLESQPSPAHQALLAASSAVRKSSHFSGCLRTIDLSGFRLLLTCRRRSCWLCVIGATMCSCASHHRLPGTISPNPIRPLRFTRSHHTLPCPPATLRWNFQRTFSSHQPPSWLRSR